MVLERVEDMRVVRVSPRLSRREDVSPKVSPREVLWRAPIMGGWIARLRPQLSFEEKLSGSRNQMCRDDVIIGFRRVGSEVGILEMVASSTRRRLERVELGCKKKSPICNHFRQNLQR